MLQIRILFCVLLSPLILSETFSSGFPEDLIALSSETKPISKSSQSQKNEKIPISDIIKGLASVSNSKKGDSVGSEGNTNQRKIVGVKKHKNYEIVLYEYPDDEGRFEDDFDSLQRPEEEEDLINARKHSSSNKKKQDRNNRGSKSKNRPTTSNFKDDYDSFHEDQSSRDLPSPPRETKKQRRPETPRNDKFEDPIKIQSPNGDDYRLPQSEEYNNNNEENLSLNPDKSTPFRFGQRENPRKGITSKSRGRPSHDFNEENEGFDDAERLQEVPQRTITRTPFKSINPTFGTEPPKRRRPSSRKNEILQNTPTPIIELQDTPSPQRRVTSTRKPITEVFDPPKRASPRPSKTPKLKPKVESISNEYDDENDKQQKDFSDEDGQEEEGAEILCMDPTGKQGFCQEYFRCSVLYAGSAGKINLKDYKCKLPNKQVGICCPTVEERDTKGPNSRALMQMFNGRQALSRQVRKLIRSNVNSSISFGTESLANLVLIEDDLLSKSLQVRRGSAAATHNRFFPTSKKIRQVSDIGFELLQTSNDLSDRLRLTNEIGGLGLKSFKSSNVAALRNRCPSRPPCGINKYRQIDGSCNNLRKPKMGQSLTPMSRVLEPAYADGRWEPRISVQGFSLPSPRLLSQLFISDTNNPDNRYTLNVMQFGQFLDHDLTSVPIFTFANESGISCCQNGQILPLELQHPNCFPIEIPADDPFYARFNQRCMNFVRSRVAPRIDCSLGYADQMNALTHWIDLSNIYGSTESELADLRLYSGGLLEFSELADRKMLLPLKPTASREIDYKAGDDRVNEMQGLMIMHLIWFREHNRVALELSQINPFWNDEELFQEARRIVTAEYQHIVYNEWLPVIIGREYMSSYGILPLTKKGFFRGYDPEIDASIENAFASAGFRMGHTLVQGIVRLINEFGQDNEAITISNHAENAEIARTPNQIDKWIRGLSQQPIQSFDPFVTQHLNGKLFQPKGGTFGMDLSSLNIQRGRDHGIPGYNAFRELCQTGKKATSFDDFRDWIAEEFVEQMKRVYDHPDDVDLWIGGISETPLVGALIGPTFTCIVGDQFARSKKGDRYFYDLGDQTHSFSPEQLQEIRKASFARILCDNGDNLEAIQPSAFLQPDFDFNSLVDCKRSTRIPRLNLGLWENEPLP